MELLTARTEDFTLTIESDSFVRVYAKALRNVGAENLVSSYNWTGEAEVSIARDGTTAAIERGAEAQGIFFDNADYPVWVDFAQGLSVREARISLPGRQPDNDNNAREAFAFRRGLLTGYVNYGNEIGRSYMRLDYTLASGERRTWQLEYEVLSTKLNYHEHWRTIVADIEEEYRMLSLDFMRRTFHSYNPESEDGDTPDIIWWNVFSGLQERFIAAAKSIINQPRHRLRDVPEYMRAERVKRFTTQLEEEYARHRHDQGHLYRTMQPTNSNDTPENRFLKHALAGISAKYQRLHKRIKETTQPGESMLQQMEQTDRELSRLSRHPFFRTVGRYGGMTQESQVLQKASGYSQVYRTWVLLNKSYSLEDGLHNLETKDIATLYEIWCFIQVKKIVERQMGGDVDVVNQSRIEMSSAFAYNLAKGQSSSILFRKDDVELAELIYNPQEGRTENADTGIEGLVSPTVPQRPDIVLQLTKDDIETGMKMTYLFDAKYRIDRQDNGVDTPPEDAINQMHRYRDAIYYRRDDEARGLKKEVIGGYILFPGAGEPTDVAQSRFLRSIDEVNIGAYPLRPGDSANREFLEKFIKGLIDNDARKILTHESVIPQKGLTYDYADASGEYILVGYVAPETLPLVKKKSIYYVRIGDRSGSLRLTPGYERAKYLLLHNADGRWMYRLKGDGPRVFSGEELRAEGFNARGRFYAVYDIESTLPVELENFDINAVVLRGKGNRSADPFIVSL